MSTLGTTWTNERRQRVAFLHGSPEERFWSRIEYDPFGGCWLWSGAMSKKPGYGTLNVEGKTVGAHRFSWFIFQGPLNDNDFVLHRCDIRACVNPAHLFLGTQKDNIADMVAKDRHARGERNAQAKLAARDIPEIRALREKGWTQLKIAERFGVSQVKISQILRGRAWASVL